MVDPPVTNLTGAIQFYSVILKTEIKEEFPGVAVILQERGEVSGCLFTSEEQQASKSGVFLYFNVSGRLQATVDVVDENGGQIEKPPHAIGSFSMRAIVIDSEGNRIALHSA